MILVIKKNVPSDVDPKHKIIIHLQITQVIALCCKVYV